MKKETPPAAGMLVVAFLHNFPINTSVTKLVSGSFSTTCVSVCVTLPRVLQINHRNPSDVLMTLHVQHPDTVSHQYLTQNVSLVLSRSQLHVSLVCTSPTRPANQRCRVIPIPRPLAPEERSAPEGHSEEIAVSRLVAFVCAVPLAGSNEAALVRLAEGQPAVLAAALLVACQAPDTGLAAGISTRRAQLASFSSAADRVV